MRLWGLAAVLLALLLSVPGYAQTMGMAPAGGPAVGYVANAGDFDASNDWIQRGGTLTGEANDNQGILSIWFRVDGGDSTNRTFFSSIGFAKQFHLLATDFFNQRLLNTAAGVIFFEDDTDANPSAGANWHHVIWAWDLDVPTCQVYIDDSVGTVDTTCSTTGTQDGTHTDWMISSNDGSGSLKFDGCLSEIYYHQTTFLSLDTVGNRRLFNDGSGGSAGGEPVDLGSDGSTPTSSQPILYLRGDGAGFGTNSGSGGNFSVNGAIADCSTSPTD